VRTLPRVFGTIVVTVALASACSAGDGGGAGGSAGGGTDGGAGGGRDRALGVEVVAAGLTDYPRAELRSDDEVRCVAEGIVDGLGIERLAELGLDVDAEEGPLLYGPDMTGDDADAVYAAYDDCLGFRRRDVEQFVADGLSEAEAGCVSDAYRASGIPRAHLVEPPHTGEPDRIEVHDHLETFLEAAETACRDWI
jgi:hypothetical protein